MIETQFASAERSSDSTVWKQYQKFINLPVLNDFIGKIDQYIVVLNSNRQIVFSNKSFNKDFNISDISSILGKRVGEALNCRYAWKIAGCGTSDFCRECDAAKAIMETQVNNKDTFKECVILTQSSQTLELGVTSKLLNFDSEDFIVFTITDISEARQKTEIEEIFYHDIANIASGLHSMLQLLNDDRITDKGKILNQLNNSSSELIDELYSNKILKSAKSHELKVKLKKHNSITVIQNSVDFIEQTSAARGKIIYIDPRSTEFELDTDTNLLNRVLINMLSNALEASKFSERITVRCELIDNEKVFSVHNVAYIPEDIQAKIFRKTFTTKKTGSGLGTQSIRIITEGYLRGRVSFESIQPAGTTFRIYLP